MKRAEHAGASFLKLIL